jgi:hypothetical protein
VEGQRRRRGGGGNDNEEEWSVSLLSARQKVAPPCNRRTKASKSAYVRLCAVRGSVCGPVGG